MIIAVKNRLIAEKKGDILMYRAREGEAVGSNWSGRKEKILSEKKYVGDPRPILPKLSLMFIKLCFVLFSK